MAFNIYRQTQQNAPAGYYSSNIWILSNFSTQFVASALPAALADKMVWAIVQETPYNQWEGVLYDKEHPIFHEGTDLIILMLSTMELAFRGESEPEHIAKRIASALTYHCLDKPIKVIMTLPEALPEEISPFSWVFEWREALINYLKQYLDTNKITLLDLEPLIRSVGADNWYGDRFYVNAKLPCHPNRLSDLIRYIANAIRAHIASPCKIVVTDLDYTLWGGAVGDEGYENVNLDAAGTGISYLRMQRFLKGLHEKGVLLAVASRNDPEAALDVFRKRPEMLLREDDFAAFEINWGPKSKSIINILKKLNLSATGVVFLDDNPKERLEVQTELPEISVLDLPQDPIHRISVLNESGLFEVLPITQEDRNRAKYYKHEKQRESTRAQTEGNPDAYLKRLQMTLIPVSLKDNMTRVVELINKTNQFNLTTRRHNQKAISAIIEEKGSGYCFRLKDRFGDYGIISVVLLKHRNTQEWIIDTWVMSCRAMGRHVEDAIMHYLITQCRDKGIKSLLGEYIRTKKNNPVENLLPTLGFDKKKESQGSRLFELSIKEDMDVLENKYIKLEVVKQN